MFRSFITMFGLVACGDSAPQPAAEGPERLEDACAAAHSSGLATQPLTIASGADDQKSTPLWPKSPYKPSSTTPSAGISAKATVKP